MPTVFDPTGCLTAPLKTVPRRPSQNCSGSRVGEPPTHRFRHRFRRELCRAASIAGITGVGVCGLANRSDLSRNGATASQTGNGYVKYEFIVKSARKKPVCSLNRTIFVDNQAVVV